MRKRTVEPIRIVRALWRIAVLCLIASGIAVAGAAAFGIAWNASTSPLSIERVYSYLAQSPGTPVVFIKDCMTVKNSGKVAATSIRGLFGLVNDVGASTAKPVLEIVDESLAPSSDATYCSNWGYSGEHGHYVGFLTSARFADGSTWFMSPPYKGRSLSAKDDPLQVASAAAYLPTFECATLLNTTKQTIKHAQLVFRQFGDDGSIVDEHALDITLALKPGDMVAGNCSDVAISGTPDVFHYARLGARDQKPPMVTYRGAPLVFGAFVRRIDFADGTSWKITRR